MITLSDIPELVHDYEAGDLLWGAAYPSLLHVLAEHDVEVIVEALSPGLASRFKESLREEFSDAYWAEHGLWIDTAGGEPPNRKQIVARARAWLQRDRATALPEPK
jgi:hypothetical protein